jgi:glutathione synthase/RimK-type ligase-like ATP-grasp enzyme
MKKRFFVEILKEICREEGFKLEIFSHEWLCKITDPKTGKFTWTEGYNYNLNSAVNYLTLYDKVFTSTVLEDAKISCVPHYLVIKEDWRKFLQIEESWQAELGEALEKTGLPAVVKLNNGSQGNDVYLCHTKREVESIVNILKNKASLCISKYYESEFEYRFYLLKNKDVKTETLFAYKKIKNEKADDTKSNWQHNLSLGARAELIHKKMANYTKLEDLAKDAFLALGLVCAAVDILETKEGYKVIEVNNGIMMDAFAVTSEEYFKIAKNSTKKMLLAALF